MSEQPQEKKGGVDADALIYAIDVLSRELDYDRSVLAAVEEGYQAALSVYTVAGGRLDGTDEARSHIAMWAHRLMHAAAKTRATLDQVAGRAQLLFECARTEVPPKEDQN